MTVPSPEEGEGKNPILQTDGCCLNCGGPRKPGPGEGVQDRRHCRGPVGVQVSAQPDDVGSGRATRGAVRGTSRPAFLEATLACLSVPSASEMTHTIYNPGDRGKAAEERWPLRATGRKEK